jgi:hypothetical protein
LFRLQFASNHHRFTVFQRHVTAERLSVPTISYTARLFHYLIVVWEALISSLTAIPAKAQAKRVRQAATGDIFRFILRFRVCGNGRDVGDSLSFSEIDPN